ncbi:MAG: EAL domain-containing protein [Desulfurivibrionaceae bacterium]
MNSAAHQAQAPEDARLASLLRAMALATLLIPFFVWVGLVELPEITLPELGFSSASFNLAVEMFAALVSVLIFSTGFHIPDKQRRAAPIILAAAFLAVGLLDFLHLLSYPGMPDFFTPNTPEKGALIRISARLLAAAALLVYALLAGTAGNSPPRSRLLCASLGYALTWGVLSLMQPRWFPALFGTEQTLAAFKMHAGQLVISLHLAALAALAFRWPLSAGSGMKLLAPALILLIGEELCFILSTISPRQLDMLGHVNKALAYLLLYRGMFFESVRLPILRLDHARHAVAQAKKEWENTFDSISDLVFLHDAQFRVIRCNKAYVEVAGLPLEEIIGHPYFEVFPKGDGPQEACLDAISTNQERAQEIFLPDLGRYYQIHFILVNSDEGNYLHSLHIMADITERKRQEEKIRHQATHDALTNLPNRTLLQDRLSQAVTAAERNGLGVAVMLLDLDNFKAINNSFGHAVGDELLVEAARRLTSALRGDDTVARLGGDEFVIVLRDVKHPEKVARVVEKVLGIFAAPFTVGDGHEVFSGGSLGVAMFPQDGQDEQNLLRHADVAMYQAKQAGRGTCVFFTDQLDQRLHEDLRLHGRLKHALADDALTLHYQPQIELASGKMSGVEALLRWHDPELGNVSPARFIPVAEATGLILPLGDWVLATACRQIAAWKAAGAPTVVAVNLSAQQFRQDDLVEKIAATLRETGAPARLLELEITETAAMENVELAVRRLAGLTSLGLKVALDDFGTGYSSLAYLKTMPIAKLKIDRSFIMDIGKDGDDEVIVQAVIGLARNLNLGLVAEGVETETQLDFLREHGCGVVQGWIFAKAMSAAELESGFLRQAIRHCA